MHLKIHIPFVAVLGLVWWIGPNFISIIIRHILSTAHIEKCERQWLHRRENFRERKPFFPVWWFSMVNFYLYYEWLRKKGCICRTSLWYNIPKSSTGGVWIIKGVAPVFEETWWKNQCKFVEKQKLKYPCLSCKTPQFYSLYNLKLAVMSGQLRNTAHTL